MKVAVLCEFSGIVRDAFIRQGHDAASCDLLPSESDFGPHFQGDIRDYNWSEYDLIIAHPPCTHLAVSGARYFKFKQKEQQEALDFVRYIMDLPVDRICVENPISVISTKIRKPDQIIQPYQFGHGFQKSTCLWLKNLPLLQPTDIVTEREQYILKMGPSKDRWKERSRTFPGIGEAMANQWGNIC